MAERLWFGADMVLQGSLSAGSLVIFILYLGKMYKPMQELSKMTDAYSKATVGYERIQELLSTANEVRDLPGARRAPRLSGDTEFRNVSFSCQPDQPVLRNLSFYVRAGQTAAFVGATGSSRICAGESPSCSPIERASAIGMSRPSASNFARE